LSRCGLDVWRREPLHTVKLAVEVDEEFVKAVDL
jgi:hypothetical protein